MLLTEILSWPYAFLERPFVLLLLLPLFFLLRWWLKKDFVRVKEDERARWRRRVLRRIVLVSRTLLILLLLIGIATPFFVEEKIIEGDPLVKIVVDNSSSMKIFDVNVPKLEGALRQKINVEVKGFGSSMESPIGDAMMDSLEPDGSVLLVTDGRVTSGMLPMDVAAMARRINATINAITLAPARSDVSVEIAGPAKTLQDVETTFVVKLNRVGSNAPVKVTVTVDGTLARSEEITDAMEVKQKLTPGYHRMKARVEGTDAFPENNVYYKIVKTVAKPRVFMLTETKSPLAELYSATYDTDTGRSLPASLKDYYAVILNNIPAPGLSGKVTDITQFVLDGGGLVVVGGKNSYDLGEYKDSPLETILPVHTSGAKKKEGEVNIVVIADVSGSMGAAVGLGKAVELGKSLIVSVLRDLSATNKVGIVAFNTDAYTVSALKPMIEQTDAEDRIARLQEGGGTWVHTGVARALTMLQQTSGSKNIIILTDGQSQTEDIDLATAEAAANEQVKIYAIGVGPVINEVLLQRMADTTGGLYFRGTEAGRIKILFGDLDEEKKSSTKGLIVMNKQHFIMQGAEPKAHISGFNQFLPKTAGRLLMSTDSGQPFIVVWRLGLGRVAAFAGDDGTAWAGGLLGASESRVHTRMLHWTVGAPDRKASDYVDISDARVGEPTPMLIKSDVYPQAEGYVFSKVDDDLYSTTITPAQPGFMKVLTGEFGVNYAREYAKLGQADDIAALVKATGGSLFSATDTTAIVEQTKAKLRRSVITKTPIRTPFLIAAMVVFLIEVLVRRLIRRD